ncbi:MAG TPA: NosD domain-containing protein [candidate division Zixibacteria bacterium]|nr:NosD domain-containing protein [candidate division Zixibacteria bacterium]
MKGKLLLVLSLLLLLLCLSYARFGQIELKASNNLPVHNLNTGLNYSTIQEAIDANETVDGNTIEVDAGTHFEQAIISKSITLVGDESDATIIDGSGTGMPTGFRSARAIIVIKADGVRIMNLTVRNAGLRYGAGAYDACIDCLGSQHDVNVENSILQNAGRGMVFGNGASSITINNNTISGTVQFAIDIGGWTSPTATNVTVSNNVIHDAGLSGTNLDGETSNCSILNNTVTDSFCGVDLGPNVNTQVAPEGNLIDGNILRNNGVNLLVEGSPLLSQGSDTNTFRRNNLTNMQHYNLFVWGSNAASFMQDFDSSNTANNKRIYYLTNVSNAEVDPMTCPDAGYLALINCTNDTVRGFNFESNNDGVLMAYSADCDLTNMTLVGNRIITTDPLSNVSILTNYGGLTLYESTGNTMTDSVVCNNTCGLCLCDSDGNSFYDNTFTNNDRPVVSDQVDPLENMSIGHFSTNLWDNGIEGNYWSDYNGTDANQDGIGDTPYILDQNNTDPHPLMGLFQNFTLLTLPAGYQSLCIVSNSTVSSPTLEIWLSSPYEGLQPGQPFIQFQASGKNGTVGFCRLTIPRTVLNGSSYIILVNSQPVNATELPASNNSCVYLYFTYPHSTHQIIVTIPEFSLLIPFLFIATTMLAATFYKRALKNAFTKK